MAIIQIFTKVQAKIINKSSEDCAESSKNKRPDFSDCQMWSIIYIPIIG